MDNRSVYTLWKYFITQHVPLSSFYIWKVSEAALLYLATPLRRDFDTSGNY